MCSHFLKRRMNNYQGDLADVVRATADGGSAATEALSAAVISDWQFPPNYSPDPVGDFGTDPFTYMMRDPVMQTPSEGYFRNFSITSNGIGENGGVNLAHRVDDDEKMKRPSSIFSRVLQISPGAKPPVPPSAAVMAAAKGPPCLQISSPRNTGIKRRKSQAKKVVCIPAPAPANSRSSGEIVPSDLWAWRKYGQKPIKGSPYPRGYYRCSSSKGCSARKQVERSRTDPNMLVITYTSEHNHPWPTQRNSLAGSSRSQPSKNNSTTAVINSSPNSKTQKPTNTKQDHNEISTVISSTVDENSAAVKEETDRDLDNRFEDEFDQGFLQTYKPTLPDSNHPEDSFFADLGEIEADPLNLLFTQGFCRGDSGQESNDLDPFGFYDWAMSNSNTTATTTTTTGSSATSHGESNRDS